MKNFRHWNLRYIIDKIKLLLYEKRNPEAPWLTLQATDILESYLKKTDIGFEWGSGRSTIWFAQKVKRLISIENDEYWYDKIKISLKEKNLTNVDYRLIQEHEEEIQPSDSKYIRAIDDFESNSLNFILIDGIFRGFCANKAVNKVKPFGLLIVDNINWFLPSDTISPSSIPISSAPASTEWKEFQKKTADWKCIWTSNGVTDTAIWIKPCK